MKHEKTGWAQLGIETMSLDCQSSMLTTTPPQQSCVQLIKCQQININLVACMF